MTEIKAYLTGNHEIEMLKDFMDPETDTGIDNIHLQWADELYYLLESLGNQIVTAPGFDERYWRAHLGKED